MYTVIARERHPDNCIEGIYGPFPTFEEANDWAKAQDSADSNFNKDFWGKALNRDSKKYYYRVYDLETPTN